ncbi:acetolactate synthase large subunit [Streptomyces sp. SLBN-31]|uniref:acetolactate synthase large subunit n=1 Tax=Streptomyces sp. SLBN-31 TaxID=2768444 RepID=UPI0011688EBB|nr:acetolactate synthase large subunit [Streptomyces sp. SLBN-31]TQJ86200.1 acetolactate synthase-1/2/3 large subunit [Streptomyces sp. SLBN-31]
MNGAHAVARTLLECGVEICFANPGTSELHFVAALDDEAALRAVPCLFEGVATGAADGWGRMTGRPAATLLHLGPGLGNGLANLHNARRAHTPLVNLVGDHAGFHKKYDAPLESDVDALAGTVSGWVRRCEDAATAAGDVAEAVAAAGGAPGQVATVILPADVSWSDGARPAPPVAVRPPATVPERTVAEVAQALGSGEPAAILLGGPATREPALRAAARIAAATGARLLCETFPARLERGAGLPAVERLGYLAEGAMAQLRDVRHLVLAGAREPVSFFAHPGLPGLLAAEDCRIHTLATAADDAAAALGRLSDIVAAGAVPVLQAAERPAEPSGALTAESAAAAVGALLPEGAIVVDEANTSGLWLPGATAGAPRHDWLTLTGGAIGQGLPLAAGAALACPDRPVLCLEADGSAMYTVSALWTHAREGLDITTVIFSNSAYAILKMESQRLGTSADGPARRDLLDLSRPRLDFVALARGMGVPATRATTAEDFTAQLRTALAEPGPHLIEADVPPLF